MRLFLSRGSDKGFYKDNGLDTLTIMAQPQVGVQGLIGGSFDFSQILGASTTAIMRGVGLKIVMVFDSKPQFWLYGAPEIKTLQQVKGKTVAIQTIGGASGQMTREILIKSGIDSQRDVKIQVIPLEGRLAALGSGSRRRDRGQCAGAHPSQQNGFQRVGRLMATILNIPAAVSPPRTKCWRSGRILCGDF